MRRLFMLFMALFFPWFIHLLDDNPGAALVALLMQVTIIGWPFATVWALRIARERKMIAKKNKSKN